MKQLLQNMRSGVTEVVEVPIPVVKAGMALVRTETSLVSAGTERMLVSFAEKSLIGKARSRPDLVRQMMDKMRREGIVSTLGAAFNRLDQPMPLGYSSSGTIIALGKGMEGFQVGDRVACAGGGYAVHAEVVNVPKNLLVRLPDAVTFEQGAFTTIAAIALHGFRLTDAQIGSRIGVIGLGLLGLIAVEIARAAGCEVFGVDLDPERVALAKQLGAAAVTRTGAEDAAKAFSRGRGLDAVLICADTSSNDPIELAGTIARDKAMVVATGAVGLNMPRKVYYEKELTFINSRSYGPGRYDPSYEEGGVDYPIGYVRWTEGRNLQAVVDLFASGRLNISPLVTHVFEFADAPAAYELITGKRKETFLGVLLNYGSGEQDLPPMHDYQPPAAVSLGERTPQPRCTVGLVGAGNFTTAMLLPVLKKNPAIDLLGIASASGVSAAHAARKYGITYATSEAAQILADEKINTVAILTRHHQHAEQVHTALSAGKNVFCEKPLALNEEELAQLGGFLADERLGPLLTVGFNRRFAPLARAMGAFLKNRTEPLVAHYRINAGFLPLSHWLHDLEQGGGRIVGEGCHFIDFITYLVGTAPVSVRSFGLPDLGVYNQDNVQLVYTFPDGSLGTVTYLANGDKSYSKERVEVFTGGRIAVLDDFRSLELVHDGKRRIIRERLKQDKGHSGIWKVFADAVITGGSPPIPYQDLIGVHQAAFAALHSFESGEEVKI